MLDNGMVIEKLHSLLGGVPFTPLEEDARTSPMTTTGGADGDDEGFAIHTI
jgi:hypothetical protein